MYDDFFNPFLDEEDEISISSPLPFLSEEELRFTTSGFDTRGASPARSGSSSRSMADYEPPIVHTIARDETELEPEVSSDRPRARDEFEDWGSAEEITLPTQESTYEQPWTDFDEPPSAPVAQEDDWGFEFEDELPLAEGAEPGEALEGPKQETATEDDWGFEFEDEQPEEPVTAELPADDEPSPDDNWGFAELLEDADEEEQASARPLADAVNEDEWDYGFGPPSEPVASPDALAAYDDSEGEDSEDWGFDVGEGELAPPALNDWGFEETEAPEEEEAPNAWEFADEPPQQDFESMLALVDEEDQAEDQEYTAEDEAIARFMADGPAEEGQEPDDEAPPAGWREKRDRLLDQIKSELKGGGEVEPRQSRQADQESTGGFGALLRKIFFPYLWVANKVTDLLVFILTMLAKLPLIGRFIGLIANKNLAVRLAGLVLPLLLVAAVLHWQGSKPLVGSNSITFPDGGAAAISNFGYDSSKGEAYGTITNKGDVIATVTPEFEVHSLQPSLNPLSLFFPKPNTDCLGEEVSVPIEGKMKIKIKCPIKGQAKKVTGEIKW